ncbi:nesprin-4 isoform X3 [Phyllostomus discolor]|uniref:Nesprin-4 isoform X3 n=1 Tax=Phyllostomus discolor TaxID=89673 RepID=A0A7E6CPH1_9CHIR|nr:nesprin-4 isoform X3 [Phyllostomus discolor]
MSERTLLARKKPFTGDPQRLSVPRPSAMALTPSLGPRPHLEPLNYPPGAPRKLDIAGYTICPTSEKERVRPDQAQKLGQDSLDLPEHFQGGLRDTEPSAGHPRLPTPSSHEDPLGGKHCETLQASLRGAAECVDALLVFSEGLAQWSEPQALASLQQVLQALGAHRDSIFWQLWQLQAQLVSYSLVYQEAITLDQDLEVEVDSDWPGPGGVWGPWVPSSLPTPAELEWDPAGDIGGFGPLRQKTAWTPGASCELCGHRGPQSWGRSPEDMLMLGLSHRKHLGGHQRCSLLQKSQNKKKRASSNLQDVLLEVDSGAPAPTSRRPLTFLLLFLLFLLLVGTTMFLPQSEGLCCSPARLARTPYLVLSYVNGPPPNLST